MRYKKNLWVLVTLSFLVFLGPISCSRNHPDRPSNATALDRAGGKYISPEAIKNMSKVDGHRVYVPVYSHIYNRENDVFYLTNTLSIRNTDEANPIYILLVDYYDTKGKPVRKYASSPMLLPPTSTLEYIVGSRDKVGGSGANFIVEWMANKKVSKPIIECVMISTDNQQGISFLSRGVNVD